jgi:hypothetical protein
VEAARVVSTGAELDGNGLGMVDKRQEVFWIYLEKNISKANEACLALLSCLLNRLNIDLASSKKIYSAIRNEIDRDELIAARAINSRLRVEHLFNHFCHCRVCDVTSETKHITITQNGNIELRQIARQIRNEKGHYQSNESHTVIKIEDMQDRVRVVTVNKKKVARLSFAKVLENKPTYYPLTKAKFDSFIAFCVKVKMERSEVQSLLLKEHINFPYNKVPYTETTETSEEGSKQHYWSLSFAINSLLAISEGQNLSLFKCNSSALKQVIKSYKNRHKIKFVKQTSTNYLWEEQDFELIYSKSEQHLEEIVWQRD